MVAWKKEVDTLCKAVLVLDNESLKIREILENSETESNEELKKKRNEYYYLKDKALKLLYKSSLLEVKGYYSQKVEESTNRVYVMKCFDYEIPTVKKLNRKDMGENLGVLEGKASYKEDYLDLNVEDAKKAIIESCFISEDGEGYAFDEKSFKKKAKDLKALKKSPLKQSVEIEVREVEGEKPAAKAEEKTEEVKPVSEIKIAETKLVEVERIRFDENISVDEAIKEELKAEFKDIIDNNKRMVSKYAPNVYKQKEGRKVVYFVESKIEAYIALNELEAKKMHVNIIEE